MLTPEQNDLLCRVEGDAPMGGIMRRHWLPVCLAEEVAEPDGAPVKARLVGVDLLATASVGGLWIGYRPDRVAIPSGSGGAPIAVDLRAVRAWTGGGGLALRRGLSRSWDVALETDTRIFALDSAHRAGGAVAITRPSFEDWSARIGLSRVFGRR